MRKIKNKKTKLIAIIIFFIIIIISAILLSQREYIEGIYSKVKSQEAQKKDITYECYGWQAEGAEALITFSDYENGISKVETPDGRVIEADGKNVVAIDYVMEYAKTYLFKMYNQNGELYQENIVLDIDIIIAKTGEGYGYKKISINYKDEDNSDFSKYYKIGENGEWKTYEDTFLVWDYDVTYQNLANTDETVTIYAKMEDTSGYSIEVERSYKIDTSIKEKVATLEAESLIKAIENENFSMGMFNIKVKDEVYSVHAYEFDESQEWNFSTEFGIEDDVATEDDYAKRMVIVKINGDLVIDEDKTITAYTSSSGYGGPKGMFIYCTGTITNKGTISMTARGAKAEGQNVYLWKNANGSYEYVPAIGATGGNRITRSSEGMTAGKKGSDGEGRQTGGGASGAAFRGASYSYTVISGTGGTGTSYSGGSGGAGVSARERNWTAGSGSNVGGAGGNALAYGGTGGYSAGGGAGNPGGIGKGTSNNATAGYYGENGTGGLLMIFGQSIINNGSIVSNGSSGGQTTSRVPASGGNSGGGSINIFYNNSYSNTGDITATGGTKWGSGAALGGSGTVTIGNISSKTFVSE